MQVIKQNRQSFLSSYPNLSAHAPEVRQAQAERPACVDGIRGWHEHGKTQQHTAWGFWHVEASGKLTVASLPPGQKC